MNNGVKLFTLSALFLALALPVPSRADPIYDNLGPGLSYDCCNGLPVLLLAMPFPVPVGPGYSLTEIDIALTQFEQPSSVDVMLLNDSGGLPGSIIGSWALGPFPNHGINTIQPSQVISGITGIPLLGNTTYWLAAKFANFPQASWEVNNTSQTGNALQFPMIPGGTWMPLDEPLLGAFRVLGDPITGGGRDQLPEPGTLLLLGTGLAALVARRRKAARS